MYRVSRLVSSEVLLRIYNSMVYPHLTYSVASWGGFGKVNERRVTRAHRRCVKILCPRSSSDYLSSSKLLSFESIHKYFVIVKMYKLFNTASHSSFEQRIDKLLPRHDVATRFESSFKLNFPPMRKAVSRKSFLFRGVMFWNSIPHDIKNCNSLYSFKQKLKSYLLSNQDLNMYLPSS